jgi:hypothetical protein
MTNKNDIDELIERIDDIIEGAKDFDGLITPIGETFLDCKVELQQLKAMQESKWQPIETAPRDGSKIDIFVDYDEGGERYPDAYFCKQSKVFCWNIVGTGQRIEFIATPPTHWIAPPISPTKGD